MRPVMARANSVSVDDVSRVKQESLSDFGLKFYNANVQYVRTCRRPMRGIEKITTFDERGPIPSLRTYFTSDDDLAEFKAFYDMPTCHRVNFVSVIDDKQGPAVSYVWAFIDICLEHYKAYG